MQCGGRELNGLHHPTRLSIKRIMHRAKQSFLYIKNRWMASISIFHHAFFFDCMSQIELQLRGTGIQKGAETLDMFLPHGGCFFK